MSLRLVICNSILDDRCFPIEEHHHHPLPNCSETSSEALELLFSKSTFCDTQPVRISQNLDFLTNLPFLPNYVIHLP
jgi:hypothetical protein